MCFSIEFSLVLKMSEKGHRGLAPAGSSGCSGGWGAAAAGGMARGATGTSPEPSQRASLRGRPRLPMEARGSGELVLVRGCSAGGVVGPLGEPACWSRESARARSGPAFPRLAECSCECECVSLSLCGSVCMGD